MMKEFEILIFDEGEIAHPIYRTRLL